MIKLWLLVGIVSAIIDALMRFKEEGVSIVNNKSFYKNAGLQVVGGFISAVWVVVKWRNKIQEEFIRFRNWIN
jgi:hypothetical protein